MKASRQISLLLLPALFLVLSGPAGADEKRFKEGRHGRGSLEYVQDVPILKVYGTPEEMGEQAGKLLGNSGVEIVTLYLKKFLFGPLHGLVLRKARKMEPMIPEEYRREMKAFSAASGLPYSEVLLLNTFGDIKKIIRCTTITVSPEKSTEKRPIFGRNFDFPTMGIAHHYGLVVVYHPKGKKSFASVTHPGLVGTHSFLNESGLAGAVMEVHAGNPSFSMEAIPSLMRYRRIAESATTVEEALKLMEKGPRCTASNLMLMEAGGKAALAEYTVREFAVRRPKDGLLFGTNHHRSDTLRGKPRCWRMDILMHRAAQDDFTWNLGGVMNSLEKTAQGKINLFSIVFLPGECSLHVAMGKLPAAQGPFVPLTRDQLYGARTKSAE